METKNNEIKFTNDELNGIRDLIIGERMLWSNKYNEAQKEGIFNEIKFCVDELNYYKNLEIKIEAIIEIKRNNDNNGN